MTIPSKVIYQGKTCDVIGYVGTKYRLAGIGNVLMSHCAKYVEPIEDVSTVRSEPKAEAVPFINEGASEPKPEQTKERKGGRPRKIKAAE